MSSRVRSALSVILAASGILGLAGCGGDPVTGGSADLTFAVSPINPNVGRYEEASVIINKIEVLPADPATAALYGGESLILFFAPTDVNLVVTQDEFISSLSLAPGNYVVKSMVITPIVLVDDNVSPTPASCIEGVAVIDGQQPAGIPSTFTFTDPPGLGFTVTSGQTRLALNVNIQALVAAYEASYTCTPGCGPGGSPCLTGFDQAAYRAAILANVSFE